MKSLKTALLMVVILASVNLAIQAAEGDIFDYFPAFILKSAKCNFSGLQQAFKNYAVQAAAQVAPADKVLVANFVSLYPEGGAPPALIDNSQGGYDQIIPSRAAAFYIAGVQAVVQQNRVVAFWCFSEAASRNAHSAMFLNNGAFALIEFGYLNDALKALQCAKSLAPDFVSPYINLGKVLVLLGRCAEAADHYNTGFLKFPNNPHYLWRAANAYKCAGNLSRAWGLGSLGNSDFPGVYDWSGFINSLNYTPPSPYPASNCPNSGSCPPGTPCGDLAQRISQYQSDKVSNNAYYLGNVEAPALDQADLKWQGCIDASGACSSSCPPYLTPGYYCCISTCTVSAESCLISYDSLKISIYSQALSFYLSEIDKYLHKATTDYQASQSKLTPEQAGYIQCYINAHDDSATWISAYNGYLAKYQQDIPIQYNYITKAINSCAAEQISVDPGYGYLASNAAYIDWVTTGHVTTALEPEYCLTVFCFSYDALSGNFGFSVSAGLAGKFTRNVFTGDTAVNLGVGLKLGAGLSSLGGNAWVKLSPNQVGVEAKFNAGPAKVGYFYGAERL